MLPVNHEIVEIVKQLLARLQASPNDLDVQTSTEQALQLLTPYAVEMAVARASPKQLHFAGVFFARRLNSLEKNIFAALGANRSGKSFVAGWLCFALFLRERACDGDLFWCVAQNLERSMGGQQQELWKALPRDRFTTTDGSLQAWSPKGGFGGHRKILLRTRDGGQCVVEFRSADQDPDTFEQAKLRGVWIDEACPEWMLDRLLPRVIDLNGFVLFSDIRHQWWQEQRLIAPPTPKDRQVHSQIFCMMDNEHNLSAGAVDRAKELWSEDEIKMRVYGESGLSEGTVFKRFNNRQIIKPFRIPDYWPRWRAIDYGSSAPTACLWLAINEEEEVYVYREYYEVSPSVAHSARMIKGSSGSEQYRCTLIDPHAKDKPPAIYGMAKTVADQFAEHGIITVGWPYIQIMGEHACVERIKFRDEQGTIKVFDTCTSHIQERRNWKHKCDKDGKPLAADAYENENSHSIDCLKGFLASNPTYTPKTIDVVMKGAA